MSVTDGTSPSTGAPVRRRHTARNAAIVVGIVLVGLIALLATRGTNQPLSSKIVGQAAPTFSGETTEGAQFNLSSHRGEWVLVNFFATWCPPCVQEHPELVKFSQDTAGTAQVISVAFDDTPEKINEFFAQKGGDWPVLAKDTEGASIDYGVVKLPESFLIDPQGKVVKKLAGGVTAAELEQVIRQHGGASGSGGS